jgi:hypothetical protein
MRPKLIEINETHRGQEHLVRVTLEADITEADRILSAFGQEHHETDPQALQVLATAKAVRKRRDDEAAAEAVKNAAPLPPTAVDGEEAPVPAGDTTKLSTGVDLLNAKIDKADS